MLPPQNCDFSVFNRIDITWTLYEILSRKLCNPDVSTCFLVVWSFKFEKDWLDLWNKLWLKNYKCC